MSRNRGKNERRGPPRVVIMGGGYGGVYAALELQKSARRGKIELSLVSRSNFFVFQPLMAEVVSGSIEPTHITNPIRRLAKSANFYKAEIGAVDVEKRHVIISYQGQRRYHYLPYDHLIIAVGSSTDLSRLPGMAEHAFPFKTLGDAFSLRNHLIDTLEKVEVVDDPEQKREMLTFVIAGGGYTGVEVAAEINSFVKEAARSYLHVEPEEIKVFLLQGANRLMPEIAEDLAEFSHKLMERKGIEIRLNTRLKAATAQRAILEDGSFIPTRTLVAAIGAAPNRVLDSIACPRDERGRLIVDETLSVPSHQDIWAVGDCAAVPDVPAGGYMPPTAQHALREAKQVARNVLATIEGKSPRPFVFKSLGIFVPIGRFSAAAQVFGLKLSGFLAWWLYRSYYLYQLPRMERKLRVLIDWTLELIFRRDIVQVDFYGSQSLNRAHYEAGETIFQQGELARNFYIVLNGQVQVLRQHDGQSTPVATLGPGEYFGEMSLLHGDRHTASVQALTPVDLMVMGGADFTALATSSTQFSELLAGVMRQRMDSDSVKTPVADSVRHPE